MARRLAVTCFLVALALAAGTGRAAALPGRFLLTENARIELFDPGTGKVRQVAERGGEPAFFPSGKGFAYVREGSCYRPPGTRTCFTLYSVFLKSFSERRAAAPGRRVFGWKRFFVRAVDVSPRGRLVFSAEAGPGPGRSGRTMEIYSSRLDGSGVRRLTHDRVFDNDPVVSPDGGYVAFARRVHGRGQIFSMRIDGTHLRRLTHDGRKDRLPSWSADGHRLVFISQPCGSGACGSRELYTVAARGGHERRLTHNDEVEGQAVFAPSGGSIGFLLRQRLWVMGTGGPPRLLLAPREPVGFEGGMDWGR